MKLSKLFSVAILAVSALSMSAQGIEFMPENARLQDALDKAKQENKMVFLDCYTSWCGPCKMMSTKIFPTQEVGDFMNPKFVSIKIDMEKGEGPEIASRLQINAYPTFVIFNNDGSEAARFVGGGDAQAFIKRVNDNLGDNGPAALEARFKSGDRDRQFLLDYLAYLCKVYRRQQCNTVAEILLEGQAETFANDSTLRDVFMKHLTNPYSPAFVYAAKNRDVMLNHIKENDYISKIGNVCDRAARGLLGKGENNTTTLDREGLDKLVAHLKDCGITYADRYRLNTLLTYAERNENWSEYMDIMDNVIPDMSDMSMWQKAQAVAKGCKDDQMRDRMKKMLQARIDDIKAGRRAEQTFPEGRQPKQTPVEMLENNIKQLNGEATPALPVTPVKG